MFLGEGQNEKFRRMGPTSRLLIRSGQWSQTTISISRSAARLKTRNLDDCGSDGSQYDHNVFSCCVKSKASSGVNRDGTYVFQSSANRYELTHVIHRE